MKGLPHLHYGEVTSRNSGLLRDFIFFLWRYRPHISLDHLIVDVSRSNTHTHTHTQPVGLLCTSDQLVAEAVTYTTHKNT